MRKEQSGFAHLALIICAVVLVAVGLAGYSVYSKQKNKISSDNSHSANPSKLVGPDSSCIGGKPGIFTADVTDIQSVNLIQTPIRLVGGSNIKTHSYIEVSSRSPVYAPMDATLTGGANYYEKMGPNPVAKVQYLLSFNDGCDVSFWLDHLVDVPDKVKAAFPAEARNDTQGVQVKKLSIKAGELIGYSNQSGGARFDFGVIDLKAPETSLTTNPKYKDNPLVKTSEKYRHAVCPYNFYGADKLEKYKSLYDPTTSSDQDIIDNICD